MLKDGFLILVACLSSGFDQLAALQFGPILAIIFGAHDGAGQADRDTEV